LGRYTRRLPKGEHEVRPYNYSVRLFVAIELPDSVKRSLADVARKLLDQNRSLIGKDARVSFTREANLHITVKFLGHVPEADVAKLCEGFATVPREGAIRLRADGVEFFPDRGPVRIIAAKMGGDVGRVLSLHQRIEEACASLGFEREGRAYRPHVTLARCKNGLPPRLRSGTAPVFDPIDPFVANEFVLMESRLRSDGPEYVPLARFPLEIARELH
jgi:2'-5' RNA ligase